MSRSAIAIAMVAVLASSALFVPALSFATTSEEEGDSSDTGRASGIAIWHPDRILDAGVALNALAAGDFLPERQGNETLAADASGRLWLAWRENYNWRSQVVWSAGGNLTSLCAGELDTNSPGLEAACGVAFANGTGAVFVLSGLGGQAASRQVPTGLLGKMSVAASIYPLGSHGGALVALDDLGNLSEAYPLSTQDDPEPIIRIPGASCLLVAELDNSSAGDEIAVGSSTGVVVELYRDGTAWQERALWQASSGISCLAFGEADPLHEGPELAMADTSGGITLLERLGDTWSGRPVWKSAAGVSVLAIGDADGDTPGNELLAGFPDNLTRLRWDGKAWDQARLWSASRALNGIVVAEVDADHAGNEVLAAGQSGVLTALGLYHPGFTMSAATARLALSGGETASFGLTFTPLDKLGGNLTISIGSLPAGIAAASVLGPVALAPPNVSAALDLSVNASVANGEYRFLVTASHQAGVFDSDWLTLVLDRKLELKIALATRDPEAQPGTTATYTVTVSNAGTVNDSYRLEAQVQGGWAARFLAGNLTGRMAPGQNLSLALKVTVPKDAAGRTVKLTVNATSLSAPDQTRSASMKVVVPQKSAPCGLFLLPAGLVGTAFMLGRKGNKREEK